MRPKVVLERAAQGMPTLGEVPAPWLLRALGEGEPIAALLDQAIDAQAAEQHIVGPLILRVQLQAIALEPLDLKGLALDQLFMLVGRREAEHRQPAVLLPELADAATD